MEKSPKKISIAFISQSAWMSIAIFSLFFGAGNVIYPLELGRAYGSQINLAFLGFFVSAIFFPFLGLVGICLYSGNIHKFLSTAGRIPFLFVTAMLILLLGPLAVMPRCLLVAYSSFETIYPEISLNSFILVFISISFLFLWKADKTMGILGKILSPILISCLSGIVYIGLTTDPSQMAIISQSAPISGGFFTGYNTLDLLAALFFAPMIRKTIYTDHAAYVDAEQRTKKIMLLSSVISFALLGAIYFGLSLVAVKHFALIENLPIDKSLVTICLHLLGPHLGKIANISIILACLTTVIGISASLSSWIKSDLGPKYCQDHCREEWLSAMILTLTGISAVAGFERIMTWVVPILQTIYPAIILLTILNIISYFGIKTHQKILFFIAILVTTLTTVIGR